MTPSRLERELQRSVPPRAAEAQERARSVVLAAHAAMPQRRRPRRLGLTVPTAAVLVTLVVGAAVAATPPGDTVAGWVRDLVGRMSPAPAPAPALVRLPGGGRLLVTGTGGTWIVHADGSRRRLGRYDDATWSPQGLFVAATRGRQLVALDPRGSVRWALARSQAVHDPRWAPSGYRVAYRTGGTLRVVAGDGSGDRRLAASRPIAPAWRPGARNELAYVARSGAIVRIDVDSGEVLARFAAGGDPRHLEWSADGRRLLVSGARDLRLVGASGRVAALLIGPPRSALVDAGLSPGGGRIALVRHHQGSGHDEVLSAAVGRRARPRARGLFVAAGSIRSVTWSPGGELLLADWRAGDQWLFLRPGVGGRVRAVASIAAQFDLAGRGADGVRVASWCCR